MDARDFETLFINSQASVPFCVSWSPNDKISVIVDSGVHVFELWPTPFSGSGTFTFRRSWIQVGSDVPLKDGGVENKNNEYFWRLKPEEVYEVALDTTLASSVDKVPAFTSYIILSTFSPLINQECYLACLTNYGQLSIYEPDGRKWKVVVDVTSLWKAHCESFYSKKNYADFETFKKRREQLKITTMLWVTVPHVEFITAQEDCSITMWGVTSEESISLSVRNIFMRNAKACYLHACQILNSLNYVLFIAYTSGVIDGLILKSKDETNETISEVTLWKEEDLMRPSAIHTQCRDNEIITLIFKRNIILIVNVGIDLDSVIQVLKTDWYEFPKDVVSCNPYQNGFLVTLQNHDIFSVTVGKVLCVEKYSVTLRPKNGNYYHCYGSTMSRNQVILVAVFSPSVQYETKFLKDVTQVLVYAQQKKTFRQLTDITACSLIEKICLEYENSKLTEISDLLEVKKLELFAEQLNLNHAYSIPNDCSLFKLKTLLWEMKVKASAQPSELQATVKLLEQRICEKYAREKLESFQDDDYNSPQKIRRVRVMADFLSDPSVSKPSLDGACTICGSHSQFVSVRMSACDNGHQFPRCCLSFLPCDVAPYAICSTCDAVALLEFVSEKSRTCTFCDGFLKVNEKFNA